MRNLSGEEVEPYVYDRVLGPIEMPSGLRDNQYRMMPYRDEKELNYSYEPGWGRGGSTGCNAYGADGSPSPYGYNVNHCYVVPSLDLVVARQGNENGSDKERSLFMKTHSKNRGGDPCRRLRRL